MFITLTIGNNFPSSALIIIIVVAVAVARKESSFKLTLIQKMPPADKD